MRRPYIRLALFLLCATAFGPAWTHLARAQRPSYRPLSRPNNSQRASKPAPNPNNAKQQPAPRTAQARPAVSAPAAKQPVLETADPETRAAFLKLIGANWIWSPAHEKDNVPVGDCYFRKTFKLGKVESGQVHIACDNQYELYVNGRPAGKGTDWRKMDVHDITKLLVAGNNAIAVKATNTDAGAAGLVARVIIKQAGGTFESYSSDATWKTSVKEFGNWNKPNVRDGEWLAAKVYGPLGGVLPWGDEIVVAEDGSRFVIDPEFTVDRLLTDEQGGSLIAMTFNVNGNILASQEGGPLLLIRDTDKDGVFDSVQPFCSEIKNVQGMLSLGNSVYAVGEGPDGGALYRISDKDGDGRGESITPIVPYRGTIGEHGPHTVRLGPDGLLYILSGNFSQPSGTPDTRSPYAVTYEGDLVQPRYEDPNGYAVGVPAPGGTILRTDMRGSFVEIVAGGLRNPYDFTFNNDGEMITYDADMEWDIGMPWYRPTRINHVPLGGEFGWRGGWAKWPESYLDSLPATLNVGPGSPTGVAFYDHTAFPVRWQNSLFVADWSQGEIHAVHFEREGATYKANITTLLKGRPLNVTGLDVGPDGALYFCTGGRGTDGGIYRIRWTGKTPPTAVAFGQDIDQAINQPQFQSDWARMKIAAVKRSLGDRWQTELERILSDNQTLARRRVRAADLLIYFGPSPSTELLVKLSRDQEPALRVRAARMMGVRVQMNDSAIIPDTAFNEPLVRLLSESDPWVRRVACESIAHRGVGAPVDKLVGLLADPDRYVAFSARRALEKIPASQWGEQVLTVKEARPFLQGAAGLLAIDTSPATAKRVLARCETLLAAERKDSGQTPLLKSDADFSDTLRVIQLALLRGKIAPPDAPGITKQILATYPTKDHLANRELVKLLAYLGPPEAPRALAAQLASDLPEVEKLQIAAYAPRIKDGWQTDDKLAMLRFYEEIRGHEGGHSASAYIENFARDFFTNLTLAERRQVLAAGENFPTSALSVLAKLPENPGAEICAELRALDGRLEGRPGEPVARLRVGIVATLGQSNDAQSLAYLRDLYMKDPARRAPVAMSLTQNPAGENWDILVDSLRAIDGIAAQEVLTTLAKVDRRPQTSQPFRNAILLGLRSEANNGEPAVKLLERWTGKVPYDPNIPVAARLTAWQAWYAKTFPNDLPAELPKESMPNKWSYDELASFLDSPEGKAGDATRGAVHFKDAQCINCHRFNGNGEALGPDLSKVGNRFQRKEILESIVYPSHVVSDQYASHAVVADGKTYIGITARNADGSTTVLQSDGKKVQLAADDIEDVQPSKQSAMPEGLLNRLTLEQVADLFAFLTNTPGASVAGRNKAAETR